MCLTTKIFLICYKRKIKKEEEEEEEEEAKEDEYKDGMYIAQDGKERGWIDIRYNMISGGVEVKS